MLRFLIFKITDLKKKKKGTGPVVPQYEPDQLL